MRLVSRGLTLGAVVLIGIVTASLDACGGDEQPAIPPSEPTPVPTTIFVTEPDPTRMLAAVPALGSRADAFASALAATPPILLMAEAALDADQRLAQSLALRDERFTAYAWSVPDHQPLRNEIVQVQPAEETDITDASAACGQTTCYRVELYNYGENLTTVALVDIDGGTVLDVDYRLETQPVLNAELADLAWQIALNTPEVMTELDIRSADDPMPDVDRALNRTSCEQSRHLCAAPTFRLTDRTLWVIVDLTDSHVVGMRWTGSETAGAAPPTESTLLGENIDALYCRKSASLARMGWAMDYHMTRSDGLRLTDVRFNDEPVLKSTKVVDWHVSYSREAGFGYSDAVGCPFFSSAAVVAMQPPTVEPIDRNGVEVGFALVQDYIHPLWPAACMYNYRQRYEFYDDGRFRVAVASNGGGCGNDGTYRPVLRIVPAGDALTFSEWTDGAWADWDRERWQLQGEDSPYTPEGYEYRLIADDGTGYFLEPGQGQFGDGGRGDNAFAFVTRYKPDEGDDDLPTIGPCCNTDYRQGPEKYMEPAPEAITDSSLVIWYVPQLKNDDTPGGEYCWASTTVEDGLYVTHSWPCYAGPMFVPADDRGASASNARKTGQAAPVSNARKSGQAASASNATMSRSVGNG